jgi:translation initiation factor IF-3
MTSQADIRHRINEQIRGVYQVRLIDSSGKMIGIVPIKEALSQAQNAGLDLVEMNRNGNPPVCKILNYGKFKYDQVKTAKEAKKKQHIQDIKEVTLRPVTDTHDLLTKAKHVKEWLQAKDKVKIVVRMKGREKVHPDLGMNIIKELLLNVGPYKVVQAPQSTDGRFIFAMIEPS